MPRGIGDQILVIGAYLIRGLCPDIPKELESHDFEQMKLRIIDLRTWKWMFALSATHLSLHHAISVGTERKNSYKSIPDSQSLIPKHIPETVF